jgi:hypothetical protein
MRFGGWLARYSHIAKSSVFMLVPRPSQGFPKTKCVLMLDYELSEASRPR